MGAFSLMGCTERASEVYFKQAVNNSSHSNDECYKLKLKRIITLDRKEYSQQKKQTAATTMFIHSVRFLDLLSPKIQIFKCLTVFFVSISNQERKEEKTGAHPIHDKPNRE